VGIETCEDSGTSFAANGSRVSRFELDAVFGRFLTEKRHEVFEIRTCLQPVQIIKEDQDDVRLWLCREAECGTKEG
jgi:hypothetical protein